ncbi:PDR/VanB family oxidoreductase [Nocardia sp. NPDC052112]|uniref:PDR/VanB family oxidoreductase n=1 Tax=Nocardia sp. NPDC052112 TaxID=3155646 RepID=UPI00343269F1
MTAEPEFTVTVTDRRTLAEGIVELTLAVTDGHTPKWQPGAHIDLILRPDLVRRYSLCGDPDDHGRLTVAVLREASGRGGSAYIHDRLTVGECLRIRGPRNNFPLRDAQRYRFIAGGVGITPLLPMIRTVAGRGGQWRLHYGGRTRASMAYLPELSALGPIEVCPQSETGPLDLDAILSGPDPGALVYCCGPESLLAAVERHCAATWPADALHIERFAPKPTEGAVDTAFDVECAQSGLTVRIPAHTSVLDAVEGAGIAVLSSCREGTCGTCETVVLDGIPDHRDSILTPDDTDVMMICCSRARTPRLVLDI